MKTELFIVTGASGTGKSTSVPILKKELPENYLIYDYDEILRPYDETGSWGDEVTEKMLQITQENIQKKMLTVFCGLIRPYLVKKYQDKHGISSIKFLLLDISTEERSRRLNQRGATMSLIGELEEHEGFRIWIDESGYENTKLEVTNLREKEVATKIKNWILKHS